MQITIVDCGIGNIKSVQRMVEYVGGSALIVSDPKSAMSADKLILPGVGAFDSGMNALTENGWIETLEYLAFKRKIPVLGICLGMQLLCRRSEEGVLNGLGWFNADVVAFDPAKLSNLKIPHMGWSVVNAQKPNPILTVAAEPQRFYHVHKYHVVCDSDDDILAKSTYGIDFVSAISNKNIYGVQFHPEKSHKFGMQLFKNFLAIS
jgi:glutamine amidotransferase